MSLRASEELFGMGFCSLLVIGDTMISTLNDMAGAAAAVAVQLTTKDAACRSTVIACLGYVRPCFGLLTAFLGSSLSLERC